MIQLRVPSGTIADIGEFTARVYTSTTQSFSYELNGLMWGIVTVTPDQMTTAITQAVANRKAFVGEVDAAIEVDGVPTDLDAAGIAALVTQGVVAALADDIAAVNANIDDQPTEFKITPA